MNFWFTILGCISALPAISQKDSIPSVDTSLRIVNFSPYFTHHIDSVNVYQFSINKKPSNYFWYIGNAPVGLSIGKDNGVLTFKVARNYFASGKLKYDFPYTIELGVRSLHDPNETVDTFFTIRFYNTEIIPSKLKPTVSGTITVDEADTVSFQVQCETGSFPFEFIIFNSSIPLKNFSLVRNCNDEFIWVPSYDLVKDSDSAGVKVVSLSFTGRTSYRNTDIAIVKVIVKNALNYTLAVENYEQISKGIRTYILNLKYSFIQLDKKIRRVKGTRLAFDLTSASTALSGTILNTSTDPGSQKAGKILPSVGLALTPIKEAAAAPKPVEQNQAAAIRAAIKRLEFMLQDNLLVNQKDPEILSKTQKLRDELKQVQVQMLDIPIDINIGMSEEELNNYFNNPKVNRKYRLK